MRLKNVFSPVANMSTKQLQDFIDSNSEGSFTLLDVRQPSEYEDARIPGSKLIPLPILNEKLQELNSQQPIIAY